MLADRVSVNIELPSQQSLRLLAPDKTRESILGPMKRMAEGIAENKTDLVRYRSAPKFAPAGQSTQMIIGATPDTDYQILNLTAGLYKKYQLKRVFFSAYLPVVEDSRLPALDTAPPLLRNTGSIRPIGCCAFMVLTLPSCWTRISPISTPCWTLNAAGLCGIWINFPWKSTKRPMKSFCAYQA